MAVTDVVQECWMRFLQASLDSMNKGFSKRPSK